MTARIEWAELIEAAAPPPRPAEPTAVLATFVAIAAGVAATLSMIAMAAGSRGSAAALLLTATLWLGPGLVAAAIGNQTLSTAVTWTLPIGITLLCLGTRVLLWTDAYRPTPTAWGVCMAIAGGALYLLGRDLERLRGPWRSLLSPITTGGSELRAMRGARTWFEAIAVAVIGWVVAAATTSETDLRSFGLLGALPAAWYIGFAATVVALVIAFRASRSDWALPLAISVGLIVVYLFGTAAVVYAAPRYGWTYKHIGLADYMAIFHRNDRASSDIYQAWPSFFSATGITSSATSSASLVVVAKWWQVLMNCGVALLLRQVFGAVVTDRRIVWCAIAVFLAGNWIGQDYFSPQSVAFLLAIAVAALVFSHLTPALSMATWRRGIARTYGWRPQRRYVVAALLLYSAIIVTHQLSPYLMIVGLLAAVPLLGLRPMWLPIAFILLAVGYALLNWQIVKQQGVGNSVGSVVQNVESRSGVSGVSTRVREFDIYYRAAFALSGAIAVAALLGARRLRAAVGHRFLALGAMAIGPAFVIVAEAYGQEGILRVYLFALPWMALGAGAWIVQEASATRRWRVVLPVVGLTCALALASLADYSRDLDYHIAASDVRMSQWFERNSPRRSVLVASGLVGVPAKTTAAYASHSYSGLPELLLDDAGNFDATATVGVVDQFASSTKDTRQWFFAFSPAIVDRSVFDGFAGDKEFAEMHDVVVKDARWKLVFQDGASELYRWVG